jgi:hypothetical protein
MLKTDEELDPRRRWSRKSRRRSTLYRLLTLLLIVWAVGFTVQELNASSRSGPSVLPPVPSAQACLQYDGMLEADPGKVTIVSAKLDYGRCVDAVEWQRDAELSREAYRKIFAAEPTMTPEQYAVFYQQEMEKLDRAQEQLAREADEAVAGGKAHVELLSPLFDGSIQPIANVDQTITGPGDSGRWSWELRPNKPGNYRLSLVMTILDPQTNAVLYQNEHKGVVVNSATTVGYLAGTIWSGINSFTTVITGLVVAVVGALAAVIGIVPKLRREKPKDEPRAGVPMARNGYL